MIAKGLQRLFSSRTKFNFTPETCYYKTLNVSASGDATEIRKAYLTLTKKYHPDVNPRFEKEYMAINEAYDILSDPGLRTRYDREKGIVEPDWDDESYWYVNQDKKEETVYTKEDPTIEQYAQEEAARKAANAKTVEEQYEYFRNKYFDNPEFTTKKDDDPLNFQMWMEESKSISNFQKTDEYKAFFPGTTKEYWHSHEELKGHEWPILRGI